VKHAWGDQRSLQIFGARPRNQAQKGINASQYGQRAGEAAPSGTRREWKSEKWWIVLPIATRTTDRYPLGPRGQGAGTSPGAVHTRAWAGVWGE
jgi:hypothetical protein